MSITQRWSAVCDAAGCSRTELLIGDQYDGKWELGASLTDAGWQTAPGVRSAYCPEHATIPTEDVTP